MTVKIKITVTPNKPTPPIHREETFFVKLPNYVYEMMRDEALRDNLDISIVFEKWIIEGMELMSKDGKSKKPLSKK